MGVNPARRRPQARAGQDAADRACADMVSEAGGVCSVQNLTSVAPCWHVAPVTVDSSGPLAAADALAPATGLPLAPGLAPLGAAHAPTTRTIATVKTNGDRRRDSLMTPPLIGLPVGAAMEQSPSRARQPEARE